MTRVQLDETPVSTRIVGALLALGVVIVHVGDQGGVTNFADPDWLGWAYRLIEVGGLLTAVVLLGVGGRRLAWVPAVLLGAGPFLGYLATRTIGLPGDAEDVGNWNDWSGTMSLLVEAALIVLTVSVLMARQPAPRRSTDSVQQAREPDSDHHAARPPARRLVNRRLIDRRLIDRRLINQSHQNHSSPSQPGRST